MGECAQIWKTGTAASEQSCGGMRLDLCASLLGEVLFFILSYKSNVYTRKEALL